jgi:hypothetical protein
MNMSRRTLRLFLGALATAAMAALGSPVHAGVWQGLFDPLSFSGVGFFQFDNHCETDFGGNHTYSQAECNVIFLSASVDMIETVPPGTGHLNFGPSTDIFDIVIVGGQLVGVDSGLFGPAFTGASCSGSLCNGAPWWIQWQSGIGGLLSANDPVDLFTGTCSEIAPCAPNQSPSATALTVIFTRLPDNGAPEPGTLGLIVGGVGAAWLARRRKAAA